MSGNECVPLALAANIFYHAHPAFLLALEHLLHASDVCRTVRSNYPLICSSSHLCRFSTSANNLLYKSFCVNEMHTLTAILSLDYTCYVPVFSSNTIWTKHCDILYASAESTNWQAGIPKIQSVLKNTHLLSNCGLLSTTCFRHLFKYCSNLSQFSLQLYNFASMMLWIWRSSCNWLCTVNLQRAATTLFLWMYCLMLSTQGGTKVENLTKKKTKAALPLSLDWPQTNKPLRSAFS